MKSQKAIILEKERYNFYDLVDIVKILRGEDGCPWDREQTHKTIRDDLIEETYEVIKKMRPILAKKGTQTVRYEISDMFLHFWFRYFEGNRTLVEMNQFEVVERIILEDYTTYSGKTLEEYFKQQFIESHQYRDIGSYWEVKKGKEQNEIDIVALRLEKNQAVAVEVKRQRKEFKPDTFAEKVQHLKNKIMPKYNIEQMCLTLEEM